MEYRKLPLIKYYYKNHKELDKHIRCFMEAYNYGKRLKTLKELTPYEYVLKTWEDEPERFVINPLHLIPGPYTLVVLPPANPQYNGGVERSSMMIPL
ncbi:MAG: hypothetical protein LBR78_01020 [Holosporales bacterium]|jgi:hypothetical protein|nr:hypothetical protein [Holosporales bacterium]